MTPFFDTKIYSLIIHYIGNKTNNEVFKLSKNEQIKTLAAVKKALAPWTTQTAVTVQLFSSLKKQGIQEVESIVGSWFDKIPKPVIAEQE